jgi:hypothetical protein
MVVRRSRPKKNVRRIPEEKRVKPRWNDPEWVKENERRKREHKREMRNRELQEIEEDRKRRKKKKQRSRPNSPETWKIKEFKRLGGKIKA